MLNKIYNEDCLIGIKKIPDNFVDLVIIDPPYKILNHNAGGYSDLSHTIQKYNDELYNSNLTNGYDKNILYELLRVMKRINIYIFCNCEQIPFYIDFFVNNQKCKMDILIWNKTNAMPLFNNKYLTDKEYCLYFRKGGYCNPSNYEDAKTVFYYPINIKDKRKWNHPTIKPEELIRKIIRNSSKIDDVILDCFIGSGTTAVGCIKEHRNYIGFEINKIFFETCMRRIGEIYEETKS
ncbi:MAG: site-specific DNA-methyltransferase [Clostridia bacterium]|nr:site-specific DNA-methyltransferase [Clostridia bacterium]